MPPLAMDIHSRVQIAVMVCAALWAIPLSNVEREPVQNVAAAMASFRGWEEAVHKPQLSAISLTLVGEHLTELPERSIGDRLGEAMVFDHSPDVQVFDTDSVVSAHHIGRHFVKVILSGVSDVLLYPGNADALTVPHAAPLDPAGEGALSLGKASLVFARMLRVRDTLSLAGCGETTDSEINSDRLSGRIKLGKLFIEAQRDEVSSAWSLGDRDGRWFGGELPTPIHIQTSQPTDNQVRVVGIGTRELKGRDRVFSRLLVSPFLEVGILSFFVEKPDKGIVQVTERLLSRDTGNFLEPTCFLLLFPLSQLSGGLVVANLLLTNLPSIRPIPERPVIDVTATPEDFCKLCLLGLGRCKPELVSNLHTNNPYA